MVVGEAARLNERYVHALVGVMHLPVLLYTEDQPRLFSLSKFCPWL